MKKLTVMLALAAIMAVGLPGAAYTSEPLTGHLDVFAGQILATGGWNPPGDNTDAVFNWTVTQATDQIRGVYWNYAYQFKVAKKGISHVIIQTSTTATAANFWDPITNLAIGGPQLYTSSDGNSNPGMLHDMFGLKFETPNGSDVLDWSVSFNSDRRPVKGNFYAKDGVQGTIDVTAWNTAFTGDSPTGSDLGAPVLLDGTSADNWIAVPDSITANTVLPEASSVLLGVLGLMSSGGYLRLRRRA